MSLGRVAWKFTRYRQLPSGAITADPTAPVQLNLQTRAGFDADPKTYFIFDDLGRLVEVDEETYFDSPRVVERFSEGIAGFRAKRDDDIENWNNWSVDYQASGDEIRSSDGAEFLQFRFTITTEDPLPLAYSTAWLLRSRRCWPIARWRKLPSTGAPDADGAVEVPLGVVQRFAYHIRTVAGTTDRAGFDGIELEVPPAGRFLDLTIDDQPATEGVDFSLAASDGRLRFTFPTAFQEDKAFRVRFQGAVFQPSVFLASRLFNTSAASLPQSIEGGDAHADVASNSIQVVSSDAALGVLGAVELSSPVVTPNGDGTNEQVAIGFDLFGVAGGALRVEVRDLSGRRCAAILDARAAAGPYALRWDARDERGELVPPGLYLIRVEVEVDHGTFARMEAVGIAY